MKYRIKISQVAAVILLVICRPKSWILFSAGLLVASVGEIIRIWASGNLSKTEVLATNGPYEMVRNPLYAGSFMMAVGFCLIATNDQYWIRSALLWLVVVTGFFTVYKIQVESEEKHLAEVFGGEYAAYKAKVPPYVPRLSRLPRALSSSAFSWERFSKNREWNAALGIISAAVFMAAKLKYGF